jgi:hypothetical protein
MGEDDLQCAMPYSSTGHPNHHPTKVGARSTLAIPELGGFIDDLIEGRKDVIGELDFHHGLCAFSSHPDGGADDALLRNGRVEDSIRAKLGL